MLQIVITSIISEADLGDWITYRETALIRLKVNDKISDYV
jgi:hypothetical protein